MKRFIKIALTVVLAAAAVSCAKELEPQKENINGTIDLTITGAINGYTPQEETKAEAQTVVRIMWKGGEKVYVFDGTKNLGFLTASIEDTDGTYAKLSGTISATQATTLTFVYSPQFDEEPDVTEGGKISLDLSEQDDEEVPFLIYATLPTAQAPASFTNEVVQFNLATSVFKCNCAGLVGEGEISQAAISGVNTKCELTLSASGAPEVSGTTPGTITRTETAEPSVFTQADQRAIFSVALPKTAASEAGRTIEVTKGVRTFTASYPNGAFDVSKSFNSVFALGPVPYSDIPFTITSTGSTTVQIIGIVEPHTINLEYRTGSSDWTTYDFTTGEWEAVGEEVLLNDGESVQFRAGEGGNATFSENPEEFYFFSISGEGTVSASENIMSLLDRDFKKTELSEYMFCFLFYECEKLLDASNLVLPATRLAEGCYSYMFYGCTGLTAAPALPAPALADNCYDSMFESSGLTNAPALPATTLADYCYSRMFRGCESLVTAPTLPATTLAEYCYSGMFEECIGLTDAPVLPVTTLADYCYEDMFRDCTDLTDAPTLPATTLVEGCYSGMFNGCTGLTDAPTLPATTLADYCYASMFASSGLTDAPVLPVTTLAEGCYYGMFSGCTGLTEAPTLPATTLADNCYDSMFESSGLTNAPALPATTLADNCYDSMFESSGLTNAPALPATTLADYCYSRMFMSCTNLVNAPALPAETLAEYCYSNMFSGCTSLASAPALPAETLAEYCYSGMFSDCTSLLNAPALSANILANYCCYGMFSGCESLATAPTLPATTLAEGCYYEMFSSCTSLVTAPALPATTLKPSCYSSMFYNCSSLTTAPDLPATSLEDGCYVWMFYGCSKLNYVKALFIEHDQTDTRQWLYSVATSGTFVKNAAATWDHTSGRGDSKVPSGWEVITATE